MLAVSIKNATLKFATNLHSKMASLQTYAGTEAYTEAIPSLVTSLAQ